VDLNFNYYYRLHWWAFVPYTKARKVAEVTLFTDQGVYGNLNISISQWPGDLTRLGTTQSSEAFPSTFIQISRQNVTFFPLICHPFPADLLMGSSAQIKWAREWYQWIGLSKDMPRYRFSIF
jgi:hypothetical protein